MNDRPFNLGIDPAEAEARLQQLLQPTGFAEGGPARRSLRDAIAELTGPEGQSEIDGRRAESPSLEGMGEGMAIVGEGVAPLARMARDYGVSRYEDPSQIPSDLSAVGSALKHAFMEDPINFLAGLNPFVGAAQSMAAIPGIRDAVKRAQEAGDEAGADKLKAMATLSALGIGIPGARGEMAEISKAAPKRKMTLADVRREFDPRAGEGMSGDDLERLVDAYGRVASPVSEHPELAAKGREIADTYITKGGMEYGSGRNYFNTKPSVPLEELGRVADTIPYSHELKPIVEKPWEEVIRERRDSPMITLGGDLSDWVRLRGYGPQDDLRALARASDIHAGFDYMREPNRFTVWANAPEHAEMLEKKILTDPAIQNAIKRDLPVLGTPAPMGPRAIDSAKNFMDTYLSAVEASPIPDKFLKEANEKLKSGLFGSTPKDKDRIRKVFSDFPGFENIDAARDFMLNNPEVSGKMRAAVIKGMEKDGFVKQGFPEVGQLRVAATSPKFMMAPGNMIGGRLVELDPKLFAVSREEANKFFDHFTYTGDTPGIYYADTPLVHRHHAAPDVTDRAMAAYNVERPNPKNPDKPKPPMTVHPFSLDQTGRDTWRKLFEEQRRVQPLNERMLESIQRGEARRGLYGFAEGGLVSGDGGMDDLYALHQKYAEGGSADCGCAPGYAGGGLFQKYGEDPRYEDKFSPEAMRQIADPAQGFFDTPVPTGLPIGQAVGTDVGYHFGSGLADAFKLANQAYEGELPPDYFQTDEGVGRALNAAMTPMLGSFGLSHAVGPALKEGEAMLGMAVKPKGGNWIKGSIENATKGLKSGESLEDLLAANEHWKLQIEQANEKQNPVLAGNANRYIQSNNQDIAIDNWVDKKLNKYIRNEMATPEDPIRLLAEKDILHVDPEKGLYPTWRHIPNQENLAQSQAAKVWEDVSDRALTTDPAKDYQKQNWFSKSKQNDNSWIEKLDPETPVYEVNELSPMRASLGFNHLVDELKNAIRHDSDLPTHLRLTPEKLEKVSVPQAVELVAKINKWREEAAANALAKNATNDAVHLVKEYPESGYKWVELKPPTAVSEEVLSSLSAKERELFNHYVEAGDTPYEALQGVTGTYDNPALAAALKYEGDMMGHCVGGYCGDVESGASRIFSLRDSKGRPHVTIETGRNQMYEGVGNAINKIEPGLWEKMVEEGGHYDHNKWLRENRPDVHAELNKESIVQVKGKGNAKPKDEYIPFVQDFIRSREWGKIGDSRNIDMVRLKQPLKVGDLEVPPGYYTSDDVKNFLTEKGMSEKIPHELLYGKMYYHSDFARGGSVQDSGATEAANLDTLFQKYADPGYAMGGSVSPRAMANDNLVYDPDEIDAIAAQIRGAN